MKKELNKWQWGFGLLRDNRTMERGWKILQIYCLNFHNFSQPGDMISKEDYKGFLFRIAIWFPIDRV